MAVDKLVDSAQLDADLTSVANAIRTKGGTSAQMAFPNGFVNAVNAIPTGSGGLDNLLLSGGNFSGVIENSSIERLGSVFRGSTGTVELRFPNVTRCVNVNFLFEYSGVTKLFAPKLSLHKADAFRGSTNLTIAIIGTIDYYRGFYDSRVLEAVDISQGGGKIDNAFTSCTPLKTLILRSNSLVTLTNTAAFNGTKFDNGGTGGTLYVPQTLIADYQAATNWSTVLGYTNNQILSIEGSIYETQYADGTPIT